MTTKPYADVSFWQGNIDYSRLIALTDGVIIRAGFGVAEDLRFQQNYAGLKDHPGEIGAYWFTVEDINGAWQAEAFLDVIGDRLFDFIVMDAEDNNAGLSKWALRSRYRQFLDTLAAVQWWQDIRIYTRATFWDWHVGIAGWEQNYRLWVAHYGTMTPRVPQAWNGIWTMHQYTDRGNGAEYGVSSASIDLNRMNPEFYPPPPPPPVVGFPKAGVTTAAVNFRRYPVVADCTKIRTLPAGAALTITGEDDGSCGYDWWAVVASDGVEGWVAKPFVEVTG